MRILVTGGAGFIGSHLVERLIRDRHEIAVLDNLSTGNLSYLDGAAQEGDGRLQFFRADIVDPASAVIVRDFRPEVVLLLAAQSRVNVSMRDPRNDLENNVVGLVNIVEASRAAGVRKVVLASSGGTIYGSVADGPADEDSAKHPASFYGLTKLVGGEYLRLYWQNFDIDYAALFWWGAAFLLGVPVMIVLLVAASVLLPEFKNTGAGRLDPTSVVMSLVAILPVIYGLKELAKHGVQAGSVAAIALGAAFGTAFVVRQRRLTNPLLDVRMFSNRTFSAALGLNVLVGAIMGGGFLLVNLYLQMVVGLTPLEAGLWLAPPAVLMIVSNNVSPRLARRIRPARLMAAGLVVAALGWLTLTQVDGSGSLALLLAGLSLMNIGMGPMVALGFDLMLGSVAPEKAGSASSISETSAEFGIAMGIAALGSVGTAVYRSQMDRDLGADLPAEAADVARESLAGATTVAQSLPSGPAADLLGTAHTAFTSGLNLVAVFSTLMFFVLAGAVAIAFRHLRPTGQAESEPSTETTPAAEPAPRLEPVLAEV